MSAGTYFATVTDFKNCTTTSPTVAITAPPALIVTASPSSLISCTTTIAISSSATGGTGIYNYLWSTGSTSSAIIVNTGTYIIKVTDGVGCIGSDTVGVLASNSTLTATINQPANICYGATTTVTVNVLGGLGSNTFLWNTGATTSSITEGAGSYCVTVTDMGGCITTACVSIIQNPQINVTIGTPPNICPGGSTTITAIGTGGQPAYDYLWNSGETTPFVLKPAGTYTVTISDVTGSACSASSSITISEVTPIITSMSNTNISCFGESTGTAFVSASGGASGYNYSWAPSGGTDASATLLGFGTYTVTVTDTIGCTKTGNVTISQPSSALAITLSSTNNLCYGDSTGTATVSVIGGTAPYYYFWSENSATTSSISGLIAFAYNVTVTDTLGCSEYTYVVVSEPTAISFVATAGQINCFGGTASVGLAVSGGTGTHTITGDDTLNLVAGTYNYIVTDSNGCTAVAQAIINPSPPALNIIANPTQISCFGGTGSVALVVSAGTGALVITGDATTNLTAGTYNYTVTDSIGCIDTTQVVINPAPANVSLLATATQISCFGGTGSVGLVASGGTGIYTFSGDSTSNLASGTYHYTVSDANGCTSSDSATINNPPSLITLSDTIISPTCGLSNGSAIVNAIGGVLPYTYLWSNGATTSQVSNLLSQTYTVTVTDSNACQQQLSLTLASSSFLIANFNATDECLNNPTQFTDSSFTSPGSTITIWEWDFDDSSPINNGTNPSHLFTSSGVYNVSLKVTSSDGCVTTIIKPVNVYFSPSANFSNTNVCFNSSTQFTNLSTVLGGDSIGSWTWNFGDSSSNEIIENPSHLYGLPGTYNVSLLVTTNYGCTDTISLSAIVYFPPVVNFVVNDSSGCPIYCPQFTDISNPISGTITSWAWNYGDGSPIGTNQNEEHCYSNPGAFTVTLTATTSNGCFSTTMHTNLINVYQLPQAEFDYSPQPTTSLTSEIYFNNLSVDASIWSWNFGDINDLTGSSLQSPTHNYSEVGNYCISLVAQNNVQCIDSVVHCLQIDPEFTFFIPNAFTPNDSYGTNDGFSGYGTNISKYELWIFDRWGNSIYYTDDIDKGWDGTANYGTEMSQRDVYVYLVEIIDFKGNKHKYRGTVTLVR